MVGIRDCVSRDIKCLVKVNAMVIDKQTHKLWSAHCWVRIVSVDADVICKVVPILTVLILVSTKNGLKTSGDKQVLLLQAKNASVLTRVIWIQNG